MSGSVTGFDDWLNRMLEQCAREADEGVATYVARAVASQMVADIRMNDSGAIDELMRHLAECRVLTGSDMPSVASEITNADRLKALHATGLLDSEPEEAYDRITRAAASALDVPFALVSLVDIDRQYFKSAAGLTVDTPQERETPLERSLCQYAVASGTTLILDDARFDPVYKNHPAVADGTVVAYLGVPLIDAKGNAVGTLCVFDTKPRIWGTGHVRTLTDLAQLAVDRMFS